MALTLALVGNPNSGKTTMFNDLTGSTQYVGNWPGVTVEKKEGKSRLNKDISIIDLPGIYSLSPYTLEEVVTREYLINEAPDVIINIIDASNIERNLYLTTQLLETGIPVIIALNMIDIVKKRGDIIDLNKLSKALNCEVIETSAITGDGSKELINKAIQLEDKSKNILQKNIFSKEIEELILNIEDFISNKTNTQNKRWFAIKVFEQDEKILSSLNLDKEILNQIKISTKKIEDKFDDDPESIITSERYNYIEKIVKDSVKKKNTGMTTSDKIDNIVTNRWLALPIFALVMFIVYYISIATVGTGMTDWLNGFFEETIGPNAQIFLEGLNVAPWLVGLIVNGIIAGVGAVLGFLPQMLTLFFFLALLEDCGYMARIAFIMDRIFRKFGLSGKSFIPMLISSGCAVPGIMASRTIESDRDRRMTIIVTSFVPCSAKLPVIALITGALFPGKVWVGPFAYFLGVAMIILSGIILKKTKLFEGDPAPFVMELPEYHMPRLKGVLIHMLERGKSFVAKAGTIIFVACGLIWFLSSFGFGTSGFGYLPEDQLNLSILARLGGLIAPIFSPLGFGDWRAAVATITGLVAKENIVGTFGVLFGIMESTEETPNLLSNIATIFNPVSALSFLTFNLLCAPCFAAIGAIRREMNNPKWTFFAVAYQTILAYSVSLIIYQIGSLVFLKTPFGLGTIVAILLVVGIIYLLFRSYKPSKKKNITETI